MSKHILIVDDEPNVRLSYRVTLEAEGYTVTEANGAAQALDAFARGKFDLVILDMRMPEMDGLDLLAETRKLGIPTPTVIITAYGDVPHAVRAMKLGAIDFLQKPLTPESLRGIVSEILARHGPAAAVPEPPADDFKTHLTVAKKLLNLQNFAGAKAHLIKALDLNAKSPDAFNLVGVLYEMQEHYASAKKYYGQAIKLDKRHEPAQQNMRRIYELFQFGSSKEPFAMGDE